MYKEDIDQVNEIDREAFPTQWPPPNYKHELQNQLARYIVVCDNGITLPAPEVREEKGISGLAAKIRRWLDGNTSSDAEKTSPDRKYVIGFAGIWVLADEAHITNIAVRQQYQRRGIGEMLIIATIDLARELKADKMTLEVRASNFAAQNLYRKYGFLEAGVRRAYYTDNREDGIIMTTKSINSDAFQEHLGELRESVSRKIAAG